VPTPWHVKDNGWLSRWQTIMETVSKWVTLKLKIPLHNPGTLTVSDDGTIRTVRYHPNYFKLLKYFINISSKLWLSMTSLEILL